MSKSATITANSVLVSGYELFMGVLSVLSIVNLVLGLWFKNPALDYVLGFINLLLSAFFLVDFLRAFRRARSKSYYFFRDFGWADLLASLPFSALKIMRMFRLVKLYAIMQRSGSGSRIFREFFADRAASALYLILFLIILVLEFGSLGILMVEGNNPAANIHTASDALWWVYVTITTVGYGDKYPVSNVGRLIGMLVMLTGVGLFGVLTGYLANKFLPPSDTPDPTPQLGKLEQDIAELKRLLKAKK